MRVSAVQGKRDIEAERLRYALDNMAENMAYRHARDAVGGDPDGALLRRFQDRFRWYRESWRGQPAAAIKDGLWGDSFRSTGAPPLCVDLELASVCDLACPFCYRQFVATPDKIMFEDLALRLIDQCAELGVPSIKLNWRGEPLLNPQLPAIAAHAKRQGILEVIVNTNATTLDAAKAEALIDAGIDLIIYSFDGGDKASYERMRPGRFKPNSFERVIENIRGFHRIRSAKDARFPRTKIQMILTEETFPFQDNFFALFEPCVDDVSVKAYTERGGKISDLAPNVREELTETIARHGLSPDAEYWRDPNGVLLVAKRRLPCEQPFQRLMVTYDGRVSMCCYDWGSEFPVGYVDEAAIRNGDTEYRQIVDKARKGEAGFTLMPDVKMPARYNAPPPVVQSLAEIWNGPAISDVRRKHVAGCIYDVAICRHCPFKETYEWIPAT